MANYKNTEEFFKKENIPYERFKTGDQLSEERFFEQVKNPVTGDFFQLKYGFPQLQLLEPIYEGYLMLL